nr:hypothetical protein Iba_chr05eCG1090 [Ipomoea batatas]GMD00719.1 hypothetical protein Iba_chr05fCG0550 [Ipomoea batatas]
MVWIWHYFEGEGHDYCKIWQVRNSRWNCNRRQGYGMSCFSC